jgi:hypothetical protein
MSFSSLSRGDYIQVNSFEGMKENENCTDVKGKGGWSWRDLEWRCWWNCRRCLPEQSEAAGKTERYRNPFLMLTGWKSKKCFAEFPPGWRKSPRSNISSGKG